jgi:beta-phosphoglucomutase-like phosphatase (HAD superfamily)
VRIEQGVVEFVKQAGTTYRLAIASGGRREQIDAALGGTPLEQDFEVIVTAEDCPIGKPDPAIYRLVRERLNSAGGVRESLSPAQALVIEDSRAGILSAKAAGMAVLGLSTTYPPEQLTESDLVLPNLIGMTPNTAISRLVSLGHLTREG